MQLLPSGTPQGHHPELRVLPRGGRSGAQQRGCSRGRERRGWQSGNHSPARGPFARERPRGPARACQAFQRARAAQVRAGLFEINPAHASCTLPNRPTLHAPFPFRFPLLTRIRRARSFGTLAGRQQLVAIRLMAFVVMAQSNPSPGALFDHASR
jgi:hypothetical protein